MNKAKKILVVSHDAGGAQLVSAYVKKNPHKQNFFCVVDGPAKEIFIGKGLKKSIIGGEKMTYYEAWKKSKYDVLLCGSSWSSVLEIDFIRDAKKNKIPSVVYLDHWINYRERFGYPRHGWQDNLPDEIWVGDEYALEKAKNELGDLSISVVPNLYFQEVQDKYDVFLKQHHPINEPQAILFMSEPMSEDVNVFGDNPHYQINEYKILEELLVFFASHREPRPFLIRFHPSEENDKYDKLINKYKETLQIVKSGNKDMFADLVRSAVVIGMESMGLVIAYLCGKKVMSFLPGEEVECPLPFAEIKKINSVEKLSNIYTFIK